jgi:hypothetical protein
MTLARRRDRSFISTSALAPSTAERQAGPDVKKERLLLQNLSQPPTPVQLEPHPNPVAGGCPPHYPYTTVTLLIRLNSTVWLNYLGSCR